MKCDICGGSNIKLVFDRLEGFDYEGHYFALRKCSDCKTGALDPKLLFEEVENSCYADDYHAYHNVRPKNNIFQRLKNFIKKSALSYYLGYGKKRFWQLIFYSPFLRMAFYPKYVENGRVLDIGCGIGKYLHYLKELGWNVYGVDISKRAVEGARASGLDKVFQGELQDVGLEDNLFDVVDMHHVFEHVPDPNRTLREVHRVLKPGGEVVFTLPNSSSLAARLFGRHWGGIDIPIHLFYFNRKSLEYALSKNGFKVNKVYYSDTFRGCAAGLAHLLFFNGRKYEKYFLPFGIALDLVFEPLLQKFGWGDQIMVKAKKV